TNRVVATGPLDLIDESRSFERLRRAVVDLRSIGNETQDGLFRFGRARRPEHPDAVGLEGGGRPSRSCVVRHGPEPMLDRWIEVELDLGGHGPLLSRGCFVPYACACTYLRTEVGAHANTS